MKNIQTHTIYDDGCYKEILFGFDEDEVYVNMDNWITRITRIKGETSIYPKEKKNNWLEVFTKTKCIEKNKLDRFKENFLISGSEYKLDKYYLYGDLYRKVIDFITLEETWYYSDEHYKQILYCKGKILKENFFLDQDRDEQWDSFYEHSRIHPFRIGEWTWYYKSGEVSCIGHYDYYKENKSLQLHPNPEHGKWIYYQKNGQINEEKNYKYGELDGKSILYNEDGSIDKVKEYKIKWKNPKKEK